MKSFLLKTIYGIVFLILIQVVIALFGVNITELSTLIFILLALLSYYIGTYIYSLRHMINVLTVKNIRYIDFESCTEAEALIQYKMKQYNIKVYYASTPIKESQLRFLLFNSFKKKTVLKGMEKELLTKFRLLSEGVTFYAETNLYIKEPLEIRVIKNH